MNTAGYEITVLVVGVALWLGLSRVPVVGVPGDRLGRNALRAQALSEAQAAVLILGSLAVAGSIAALLVFNASSVKACMSNEKAIETALRAYQSAVGSFPAMARASVTVYDGTTPGTFSNPDDPSIDYLGQAPVDPANPAGTYMLTYIPATGTAPETYAIKCPGIHSKGDLMNLPDASTATAGHVMLVSGQGFRAV